MRRVGGILTRRRRSLITSSLPSNTCVSAELRASRTCLLLPCHSARLACARIGAKTVCQRAPCMRAHWRQNCVLTSSGDLAGWIHNLICNTPFQDSFWCLGYQIWHPLNLRTLIRLSRAQGGRLPRVICNIFDILMIYKYVHQVPLTLSWPSKLLLLVLVVPLPLASIDLRHP